MNEKIRKNLLTICRKQLLFEKKINNIVNHCDSWLPVGIITAWSVVVFSLFYFSVSNSCLSLSVCVTSKKDNFPFSAYAWFTAYRAMRQYSVSNVYTHYAFFFDKKRLLSLSLLYAYTKLVTYSLSLLSKYRSCEYIDFG